MAPGSCDPQQLAAFLATLAEKEQLTLLPLNEMLQYAGKCGLMEEETIGISTAL